MLVTYLADIDASPASQKGLFIAFSKYEERDIPKQAGWRWDASTKRWFTSDPEKARRLESYADPAARAQLGLLSDASAAAMAASRAASATIEVPTPPGLSLLPYQRAGVSYAMSRRDTLIADEMGLGKTIQAIGVANCMKGLERALIVCPASLRLNWVREWKRWHVGRLRPVVVTDLWPLALRGADLLVAAILSYEGVLKWKAELDRIIWQLAIFDEAHFLKNGKAKRTKAVFGFQRAGRQDHLPPLKAERKLFLTGTPIVNRPEELWPLVHAIDRAGLGANQADYRNRYVNPPLIPQPPRGMGYEAGWKWREQYARDVKAARMKELHDRLRSSFMVRRLKADVLTELPAKRRQVVLLGPDGMADVLAAERRVLEKTAAEQVKLREELASLPHADAVKKLRMWRGAAMTEISRIRHETAVKKLPAVIEHLFAALEETEKLVVFCHHHDVVDGLRDAFGAACVIFDGRMNDQQKAEAVAKFQGDRGVRVFVGSIRAAGLGITLTAASLVTFAELDWTPAAMVQAEDRLHRIGQRDAVLVQHLVVDGSIDQRMSALLIQKSEMIDAILDGKLPPEAQQSVLDGVLQVQSAGKDGSA